MGDRADPSPKGTGRYMVGTMRPFRLAMARVQV